MRALFLLLVCLLTAVPAAGQQPDDAIARWREEQLRAARKVTSITCVEESKRRVDSPYGTKEILTLARLRAAPAPAPVERVVDRVEVNGRSVPEPERRRVMRYLRHGRQERDRQGRDRDRVGDLLLVPTLFSHDLRQEGTPRPDPLADGALRIDFVGSADQPIERLTLWFTRRGDRLVRSRLLARHRPDDPPLVVETLYQRRGGLDVPDSRHVEGSVLVRKRSRTYTMLYDQQIAYRDYQFQR